MNYRLRTQWKYRVVVMIVCMVLLMLAKREAYDVYAADTWCPSGLVYGYDSSGEAVSGGVGVAVWASDGNAYVFTASDIYSEDASTYIFYSQATSGDYELELSAVVDDIGMVEWQIESPASSDTGIYTPASLVQGDELYLVCYDASGEIEIAGPTEATDLSENNGFCFLGFDDTSSLTIQFYMPAAMVTSSGYLAGIVIPDDGWVWALGSDSDTFYGTSSSGSNDSDDDDDDSSGSGSESGTTQSSKNKAIYWVIGIAAVGGVGFFIWKKKSGENGTQNNGQLPPVQESYGTPDAYGTPQPSTAPDMYSTPQPSAAPDMYGTPQPSAGPDMIGYGTPSTPQTATQSTYGIAPMTYCICGHGGYMDGRIYPVQNGEILFGRDASAMIRYPGETKGVSRIHCKVYLQGGILMLEDLGSSYGTFVEGRGKLNPQVPVELQNGDVFYLGEQRNSFKIQQA